MGDIYYEDRRRSGDYADTNTDYYYPRTEPRYEEYSLVRNEQRHHHDHDRDRDHGYDHRHHHHSPGGEVIRYEDDRYERRDDRTDYRYDERRQRSLSPSHLRRDHEKSRGVASEHHEHHPGKDIAATIIGGVVGGAAARKAGDRSKLATAAGVIVGAWGGHELEKEWDHHEEKEKEKARARRRSHDYGR